MITKDDIDPTPYFFGDESKQQKAIDALSTGLRENKGGVYLVVGGSRTGKSSAIEQVQSSFVKDQSFHPLQPQAADAYFNNDLFGELKAAIKTSKYHAVGKLGDKYLPVYESNKSPHKILFINEGVPLPESEAEIRKILDSHKKLSPKTPLSIVIDCPDNHALLLPGAKTIASGKAANKTRESLKSIDKDYPELQILPTTYNRQQVKEELWKMGNDYPVKAIRDKFGDTYNVNVKHPAVVEVFKALKEKDRAKYDIAFDRIPSVERQI